MFACGDQEAQTAPVGGADVDQVVSEVRQMSLDSIDMSTQVNTEVPGYEFMPDPTLQPGTFVDLAALCDRPLPVQPPDVDDANGDATSHLDTGHFAPAADSTMWSQPYVPGTIDLNDLSDLIWFQQ